MLQQFYQHHYHPQAPLAVWEFLLHELQLGRKYAVMSLGLGAERLMRQLLQHVRVVCVPEANERVRAYLRQELDTFPNFLLLDAELPELQLADDSMDCLLLRQPAAHLRESAPKKELQRVLRLNSFAILIQHQWTPGETPFAQAYLQFLKNYNSLQTDPYLHCSPPEDWSDFLDDAVQQRSFPNQQRLDFEGLKGYYLSCPGAFTDEHPQHALALKALKILFHQFQTDGSVTFDYQTQVYYGLMNKYVPAISLRKSLFFNLLRPFAFGFYVLVKMNIYFWKMVYSVKEKIWGR